MLKVKYLKVYGVILACLLLAGKNGFSQQYPVYSQYIFNGLILNPAYAGSHVQFSATAMYRNQWLNFEGAPKTLTFTGHTTLNKGRTGVGLLVSNDQIGSYSNNNIFGSYAYIINAPFGTLALGLQAGFNHVRADFSELNLQNPDDPSFMGQVNDLKPNFGTGAYFHNDLFFVGFSIPFLLNNKISNEFESVINEIREARYYYIHSGIMIPLDRMKTVQFNPSVLIRAQEGSPISADINASFIFYEVFSAGASHRSGDAIITFLDIKLSEGFHFGYSYDWTTSDIGRFSNGTHEFALNYRFRIRGVHRNVECPSVFKF